MDLRERFLKFVPDRPNDGCWVWRGTRSPQGYGYIRAEGKNRRAHRVAIYLETGEWPTDSQVVCHKCDNPPCVRPDHLFVGTHSDNMQDCVRKGRQVPGKPSYVHGSAHGQAILTEELVRKIRGSGEAPNLIAERYGVSKSTVYKIRQGRRWRHV